MKKSAYYTTIEWENAHRRPNPQKKHPISENGSLLRENEQERVLERGKKTQNDKRTNTKEGN